MKGLFQNTAKNWANRYDPIDILFVVGDFEESYQDVLYAVYKNVPVGGIAIFDDMMAQIEVMRYWLEFKDNHGIPEDILQFDQHSACFHKKVNNHIEQSKKSPMDIFHPANK